MAASDFVTLRGGVVASLAALRVGWDLEARGFSLRSMGDRLQVLPPDRLTPQDAAAIREHKAELLALVRYSADVQQEVA